ncbi:hypothetical protein KKF81_01520, partial [Candidatus Micrarchaeota archaeon]|nr:hypothetical protein [Candidatus Micrarchaeota archaeon]MBU1165598.1 hypothetical protein [Candidatus Micrarchaeota archaeon]MBU1886309.1 hypothetical protein [Candidatus Micrarchaeota archaeon]
EWNLSQSSGREIQNNILQLLEMLLAALRIAIEAYRRLQDDENESRLRDAQRKLANLVGDRHAEEASRMLQSQDDQVTNFVTEILRKQINASRNLHTGQLDSVSPRMNE